MRQADLSARRQRDRAIAAADAAHRCASCRRTLPPCYMTVTGEHGTRKFCDGICRLDYAEAEGLRQSAQTALKDAR